MKRQTADEFDQELLDLYDEYVHGKVTRRDFMDRASRFAVGGLTAAALLEALGPNYAFAQQVPKDDARIKTEYAEYPSPKGAGKMRGSTTRRTSVARSAWCSRVKVRKPIRDTHCFQSRIREAGEPATWGRQHHGCPRLNRGSHVDLGHPVKRCAGVQVSPGL